MEVRSVAVSHDGTSMSRSSYVSTTCLEGQQQERAAVYVPCLCAFAEHPIDSFVILE